MWNKGLCKHRGCNGCTPESCPGARKCKPYAKCTRKAWEDVHHEDEKTRKKTWNDMNADRLNAIKRAKYHANPEPQKFNSKKWAAEHPENSKIRSKAWYDANYIHVGNIKGVIRPDGSFIQTRSMSEAYFLTMLDDNKLPYKTEIPLLTPMGKYIADIYLPTLNIYVEVKADRWVRDDQMAKIEYLRERGYSIIIVDSALIDDEFGF